MFRRANVTAYADSGVGTRSNAGRGVAQVAVVALLLLAVAASAQPCPKRCLRGDPNGVEPTDEGKLCSVDSDCHLCDQTHPDYDAPSCAVAPRVCSDSSPNAGVACLLDSECGVGGSCDPAMCQARTACVHLEWRPAVVGVIGPGQIINAKLYAVSSTGFDQEFESIEAILVWNPLMLDFLGKVDPCTVVNACVESCPANTYRWFSSTFPNDCAGGDGINAPCPGDPDNDGDAFFIALSRICCSDPDGEPGNCGLPADAPVASSAGLHITTFQFEVLSDVGTSSTVSLLFDVGGDARTRVLGGSTGAEFVTGDFPGDLLVTVEACAPPTVLSVGSKVIEIDPGSGSGPVGFLVTSDDPSLTCIARYAQATGELGPAAVFQTPDEWASVVRLRGRRIMPDATYKIQKDCGTAGSPVLSTPVEATMKLWADTDDVLVDGLPVVDFKDIARVVQGFLGNFEGQDPPLTFADVDLVGITNPNLVLSRLLFCIPNDVIDFKDIAIVVDAFVLFGEPVSAYEVICDIDFCTGD